MTRSTSPSARALDLISDSVEPRPFTSVLAPLLALLPPLLPQPAAAKANTPVRSAHALQPARRVNCLFIVLLPSPPPDRARAGVLGATRGCSSCLAHRAPPRRAS